MIYNLILRIPDLCRGFVFVSFNMIDDKCQL